MDHDDVIFNGKGDIRVDEPDGEYRRRLKRKGQSTDAVTVKKPFMINRLELGRTLSTSAMGCVALNPVNQIRCCPLDCDVFVLNKKTTEHSDEPHCLRPTFDLKTIPKLRDTQKTATCPYSSETAGPPYEIHPPALNDEAEFITEEKSSAIRTKFSFKSNRFKQFLGKAVQHSGRQSTAYFADVGLDFAGISNILMAEKYPSISSHTSYRIFSQSFGDLHKPNLVKLLAEIHETTSSHIVIKCTTFPEICSESPWKAFHVGEQELSRQIGGLLCTELHDKCSYLREGTHLNKCCTREKSVDGVKTESMALTDRSVFALFYRLQNSGTQAVSHLDTVTDFSGVLNYPASKEIHMIYHKDRLQIQVQSFTGRSTIAVIFAKALHQEDSISEIVDRVIPNKVLMSFDTHGELVHGWNASIYSDFSKTKLQVVFPIGNDYLGLIWKLSHSVTHESRTFGSFGWTILKSDCNAVYSKQGLSNSYLCWPFPEIENLNSNSLSASVNKHFTVDKQDFSRKLDYVHSSLHRKFTTSLPNNIEVATKELESPDSQYMNSSGIRTASSVHTESSQYPGAEIHGTVDHPSVESREHEQYDSKDDHGEFDHIDEHIDNCRIVSQPAGNENSLCCSSLISEYKEGFAIQHTTNRPSIPEEWGTFHTPQFITKVYKLFITSAGERASCPLTEKDVEKEPNLDGREIYNDVVFELSKAGETLEAEKKISIKYEVKTDKERKISEYEEGIKSVAKVAAQHASAADGIGPWATDLQTKNTIEGHVTNVTARYLIVEGQECLTDKGGFVKGTLPYEGGLSKDAKGLNSQQNRGVTATETTSCLETGQMNHEQTIVDFQEQTTSLGEASVTGKPEKPMGQAVQEAVQEPAYSTAGEHIGREERSEKFRNIAKDAKESGPENDHTENEFAPVQNADSREVFSGSLEEATSFENASTDLSQTANQHTDYSKRDHTVPCDSRRNFEDTALVLSTDTVIQGAVPNTNPLSCTQTVFGDTVEDGRKKETASQTSPLRENRSSGGLDSRFRHCKRKYSDDEFKSAGSSESRAKRRRNLGVVRSKTFNGGFSWEEKFSRLVVLPETGQSYEGSYVEHDELKSFQDVADRCPKKYAYYLGMHETELMEADDDSMDYEPKLETHVPGNDASSPDNPWFGTNAPGQPYEAVPTEAAVEDETNGSVKKKTCRVAAPIPQEKTQVGFELELTAFRGPGDKTETSTV